MRSLVSDSQDFHFIIAVYLQWVGTFRCPQTAIFQLGEYRWWNLARHQIWYPIGNFYWNSLWLCVSVGSAFVWSACGTDHTCRVLKRCGRSCGQTMHSSTETCDDKWYTRNRASLPCCFTWNFKDALLVKAAPQISHWKGWSPKCSLMWFFFPWEFVNLCPQVSHTKGLSPVCWSMWPFKCDDRLKVRPQMPHMKGRSPEWIRWCILKLHFWAKANPHSMQTNGFSPVCVTHVVLQIVIAWERFVADVYTWLSHGWKLFFLPQL